MEAGDGCVFVDKCRGLEDSIGIGVLGDGVEQADVEKTWWGDGVSGEYHQPDRT